MLGVSKMNFYQVKKTSLLMMITFGEINGILINTLVPSVH